MTFSPFHNIQHSNIIIHYATPAILSFAIQVIYMYPLVNSKSVTDIFSFRFSSFSVFRTCCFCLMFCDYFILCVFVGVCVCECVFASVYVRVFICVFVCLCVCMDLVVCICVWVDVYLGFIDIKGLPVGYNNLVCDRLWLTAPWMWRMPRIWKCAAKLVLEL